MRGMPKATAASGRTLLDASDHVLIMIDHQPQMAFATASIDGTKLRNNIALVAHAAKAFAVPAILTTLSAESFAGSMLGEVRSAWPSTRVFDRTNMNCWEDPHVIAEVNRHGRSRIVLSGLWTGVCVASAALSALDQDFDVYVITDACGDLSEDAHRLAIDRMLQIGARPLTALTYLLELQRDWARTGSAAKATNIILTHGGLHGIGLAYAAGDSLRGRAPDFFIVENETMATSPEQNKALVLKAFDTLFNKRDYVAAKRFWSETYIQHSAHIPPGRDGLFNLVRGLPDTLCYENHVILAEEDFVIAHGRFSGHGRPASWIAADVVRVEDGKLAEHWDVLQDEATQAESLSGLPMFGDRFPA